MIVFHIQQPAQKPKAHSAHVATLHITAATIIASRELKTPAIPQVFTRAKPIIQANLFGAAGFHRGSAGPKKYANRVANMP